MANQTRTSSLEELRCALRDEERKISELGLMLADYYAKRSRLIRELRRLCAQPRDAEKAGTSTAGHDRPVWIL